MGENKLSQLLNMFSEEKSKWKKSPRIMDLLMNDRSTQGARDYAGNIRQRGATLAGLIQGQEPTEDQKALFSGIDPTTDEGAMNFALTFAGPMAKTANLAKLKIAERMRAEGASDNQIHKETGWFFGMADGMPRFEIADDASKQIKNAKSTGMHYLEDWINHPELQSAYPEMFSRDFAGLAGNGGILAMAKPGHRGGEFSQNMLTVAGGARGAERKSITLHELQHAIQQREGFANGGKPDPRQQYQRLAGEAEARLTQSRMDMTPGQRLSNYPPSMFDVPVNDQIVRFK